MSLDAHSKFIQLGAGALLAAAVLTPAAVEAQEREVPTGVEFVVELTSEAEEALERGEGWEALDRGIVVRYEGEGAVAPISGPFLRTMLMYPNGETAESGTMEVSIKPGSNVVEIAPREHIADPPGTQPMYAHTPAHKYVIEGGEEGVSDFSGQNYVEWIREAVASARPGAAVTPPTPELPQVEERAAPLPAGPARGKNPFLVIAPNAEALASELADAIPLGLQPLIISLESSSSGR